MDLDVEAGSRVALVGLSGAGKTTVTSLVARLYDPQEGRVHRRAGHKGLHAQVLGTPSRSCRRSRCSSGRRWPRNIGYGKAGATREIEHAAGLAGADWFIRELPEGYDTLLSERGESLSGDSGSASQSRGRC